MFYAYPAGIELTKPSLGSALLSSAAEKVDCCTYAASAPNIARHPKLMLT